MHLHQDSHAADKAAKRSTAGSSPDPNSSSCFLKFLALPVELQAEVASKLPLADLRALSLASAEVYRQVNSNLQAFVSACCNVCAQVDDANWHAPESSEQVCSKSKHEAIGLNWGSILETTFKSISFGSGNQRFDSRKLALQRMLFDSSVAHSKDLHVDQ